MQATRTATEASFVRQQGTQSDTEYPSIGSYKGKAMGLG
jgi:hypothetical protein